MGRKEPPESSTVGALTKKVQEVCTKHVPTEVHEQALCTSQVQKKAPNGTKTGTYEIGSGERVQTFVCP